MTAPWEHHRTSLTVGSVLFVLILLMAVGCGSGGRSNLPNPSSLQNEQGYVGSQSCQLCHGPYLPATFHGTYYQDWLQSVHGQTADMTPSDQTIVADVDDNNTNDFEDGFDLGTLPEWEQFTLAGGALGEFAPLLGFDAAKGVYNVTIGTRTFDVAEVAGIGRRRQTYQVEMVHSLYVLPILFDVKVRSWNPFVPENWYTWNDTNPNGLIDVGETITGLLYPTPAQTPITAGRTDDAWERSCAGCHWTGLESIAVNTDGELLALYSEDGVGCEACHGPGRRHVESSGGRGLTGRAIVNPTKLTVAQQRDICMSCHSRGVSVGAVGGLALDYPWRPEGAPFRPGQALADAFTIQEKPNEPIHPLQGGETHMGLPASQYGAWSQDCQDCHSAHDTTNLKLVRMTAATPNSGDRNILYTTCNGPTGSGGLMGDASDGDFTDICEVCHTQTSFFRNDASTPVTDHFNGERCSNCHKHHKGLLEPSGIGGENCVECHDYLFLEMRTVRADYRHLLADSAVNYPTSPVTWRCLACHVDHEIFEPGTNPQSGRGANLRTDILEIPTLTSGFGNTDFENSGNGGLCLSCHRTTWTKSYTRPDGSTTTPYIPYNAQVADQVAAYNGAMHGGFYRVLSTFENAGTNLFLASCSKCHDDDLDPKSNVNGQVGSPRFGLHLSTRSRMLSALGFDGAANPLEEEFCYRCHSKATDPIGGTTKTGANADWYNFWFMIDRAEGLWEVQQKAFTHDVASQSGSHRTIEGTSWNWNPASDRHVECEDCHNPHANGPPRTFDTTGLFAQPLNPTIETALTPYSIVWGVDVPLWPAPWNTPDPATAYTRVDNSTYIWQICLKCHSGYGYGASPPPGETDQAREFNPNNASYHACIGPSKTTYPPNTSFVGPWTKTSPVGCADCHTTDVKLGSQGPHGSAHEGILAGAFDDSTGQIGTENHLCFKCHDFDVYGRGGSAGAAATGFSGSENLHTRHASEDHFSAGRKATCFDCHAAVPHGGARRSLLIIIGDPAPYNNGSAALSGLDIAGWPASGNWIEASCSNSPCH